MKKIKLTGKYSNGRFALVDDEDYELLKKWKWGCSSGGYAYRKEQISRDFLKKKSKYKNILLHRFILNPSREQDIDHRNLNPLDNRKANLRICTRSQNFWNKKIGKTNTSGFKGVSPSSNRKLWRVKICKNKKQIHIGYFKDILKAARAYNLAAKKYFGEFARLNNI